MTRNTVAEMEKHTDMEKHTFPRNTAQELVEMYAEEWSALNLKESDFKSPKAARWQEIYLQIICGVFQISADQFVQQGFDDDVAHPEINEDCNRLLRTGKAMSELMHACDVPDFKMNDLLAPQAGKGRLEKIMSALINFLSFRKCRMEAYESILEEEMENKSKLELLEKEKDDLQRRINAIKATRAEKKPQVDKLEARRNELKQTLEGLSNDVAARQKALSDEKEKIADENVQAKEIQTRIATLNEEMSDLDGKIVQSPERMTRDMEKMKTDIQQLRLDEQQLHSRMSELQSQVKTREAVNRQSDDALRIISAANTDIDKVEAQRAELSQSELHTQEKKDALCDLDTEIATLRRDETSKHDRLARMTQLHDCKVADLKETLQKTSSGYEQSNRVRQREDAEADALEAQTRDLHQSDAVKQAQHDASIKELTDTFSQLEEQVELYNKRLGETWNATRAKIDDDPNNKSDQTD